MLPVITPAAQLAALEKDRRWHAARLAMDTLKLAPQTEAVCFGNLPKLWAACAVRGEEQKVLADLKERAQTCPEYGRAATRLRYAQAFFKTFQRKLEAR